MATVGAFSAPPSQGQQRHPPAEPPEPVKKSHPKRFVCRSCKYTSAYSAHAWRCNALNDAGKHLWFTIHGGYERDGDFCYVTCPECGVEVVQCRHCDFNVLANSNPPHAPPGGDPPRHATASENTGRWTADEHRLFLQGLEQHGKGWKKIATLIRSRTVVQIKTHAQKYFQKLAKARSNGEAVAGMGTAGGTAVSGVPRVGGEDVPVAAMVNSDPNRKRKAKPETLMKDHLALVRRGKHKFKREDIRSPKRPKILSVTSGGPKSDNDDDSSTEGYGASCHDVFPDDGEGEGGWENEEGEKELFTREEVEAFHLNKCAEEAEAAEESSAHAWVDRFKHMDLDPDSVGPNEPQATCNGRPSPEEIAEQFERYATCTIGRELKYKYKDFKFFDTRTENEKYDRRRKNLRERYSQVQLYFYMRYVQMEVGGSAIGGFSGLCHRANRNDREEAFRVVPEMEAKHMFDMLELMLELTGSQKKKMLNVLNGRDALIGNAGKANLALTLPRDTNDVRRIMMEGVNSVFKNFPAPRVFNIANHACVDLKEVIRLAAGHGAKFNFAYDPNRDPAPRRNMEGLNGTPAVDQLLDDILAEHIKDSGATEGPDILLKTSVGWIYFWSDSFLRCFTKQRENSVWVLTVTICPPEATKSLAAHTHVLAIGKSGENHTPVIEHYLKEAKKLLLGFDYYHGETNVIRRMALGLVCWNADRPERHMIGETRQEGHWGKVTGYCVKLDQAQFAACDDCHRRLVASMIGGEEGSDEGLDASQDHACSKCFNWTLDPKSEEQKTVRPNKKYPKSPEDAEDILHGAPEGRDLGQDRLGPVKLTTEFLQKALRCAYEFSRRGYWTKGAAKEYLMSCSVPDSRIELVLDMAEEDRKAGRISDPTKYEPETWSILDMHSRFRLPDLPMHAIAHGIGPDVMEIWRLILAHKNRYKPFVDFANKILDDVASFRLDWCKVKSLPKGGWVAENCMAFIRLFPSLGGSFLSANPLSSKQDDPIHETVLDLKRLLNAFSAMISVLMSRKKLDKTVVNNHMKLFMSSADFLQKGCNGILNNANDDKRKEASRKKGVLGELLVPQLATILEAFEMDAPHLKKDKEKALDSIRVQVLREKCAELGLEHGQLKTKVEIQRLLFNHISGREEDEEDENQKSMCWNKGAWVSLTTNVADQIEYLGVLILIW